MIYLTSIEVSGQSEAGPFRGSLSLMPGLQVISARNSYGKSLAAKVIPWCLGLEPLFSLPDNDPSFFPVAVREELALEGQDKARVLSSECSINLTHSDGRQLSLTREIKGDPSVVRVRERASNGVTRSSALHARIRTMQDDTGGLQKFIFDWLRWPRLQVATFKGTVADIYLENLAPLFFIEQDEGWAQLQARQITRYAQQQIAQVSVEYLLGAVDSVKSRLAQQSAILRAAGLRESARSLAERVNALFTRNGWQVSWSGHGSLPDIVDRWSSRTLRQALLEDAEFDLANQRVRLSERAETLRRQLTRDPIDSANASAHSSASQRVIELKRRRHGLNEEARNLRVQYEQAEELLGSLEHRIHAATDVLRLKTTGVGRLEEVECPICHRSIDPATFSLTQQSVESVTAHIEALKRDRNLLKKNTEEIRIQLIANHSEITRTEADFRDAEWTLAAVTEAIGTVREQLAGISGDLRATERSIDRLVDTAVELDDLQGAINSWLDEARVVGRPIDATSDLARRLAALTESLSDYLLAFGHSEVNEANVTSVHLDDQYIPLLGVRRLQSLGSASDRSRLIAAYSLALAAASQSVSGLHPGIVILDEPLQQNPDDSHRDLFLEFLTKQKNLKSTFQTIIFTFLRLPEIDLLRKRGMAVVTPEGDKFLSLEGSASQPSTEGSK